jgi:ribosomal protein S10
MQQCPPRRNPAVLLLLPCCSLIAYEDCTPRRFQSVMQQGPSIIHPPVLLLLKPMVALTCNCTCAVLYTQALPIGDAAVPTKRTHWTVIRGPHVHKTSREQFARITQQRVITYATNNASGGWAASKSPFGVGLRMQHSSSFCASHSSA